MERYHIIDTKKCQPKIKSSNSIPHSLLPPNHTRLACDFLTV